MVASAPPTGPFDEGRRTRRLRPFHGFTKAQVVQIRTLKKQGMDERGIATELGVDVHRVELALAALRTRRASPTRFTVNVGDGAHRFIRSEQRGTEPMWQTVDRLLTELQSLRHKRKTWRVP